MASKYFKSPDGRSVTSVSSGNRSRRMPDVQAFLERHPAWIQIDYQQFRRLRTRIEKGPHIVDDEVKR